MSMRGDKATPAEWAKLNAMGASYKETTVKPPSSERGRGGPPSVCRIDIIDVRTKERYARGEDEDFHIAMDMAIAAATGGEKPMLDHEVRQSYLQLKAEREQMQAEIDELRARVNAALPPQPTSGAEGGADPDAKYPLSERIDRAAIVESLPDAELEELLVDHGVPFDKRWGRTRRAEALVTSDVPTAALHDAADLVRDAVATG